MVGADDVSDSMITVVDCLRLLLADMARLQRAVAEGLADGTIYASDDHTDGPAIGDIAPQRPADELESAMASPDPLMFRQALILVAAALGLMADQTDQTVAEVLSEITHLVLDNEN